MGLHDASSGARGDSVSASATVFLRETDPERFVDAVSVSVRTKPDPSLTPAKRLNLSPCDGSPLRHHFRMAGTAHVSDVGRY